MVVAGDDGREVGDSGGGPNQAGDDRDLTANDRDQRAAVHDEASKDRDRNADARDVRAVDRERAGNLSGAPDDRAAAFRDRQGGSSDRNQAADDRVAAAVDRVAASEDRAASLIDGLTGAQTRTAGLAGLERDIARAKRTRQPFTLVFVDVDDLKGLNDSRGHVAGDQLLRATVDSIRSHLRSYDQIVRFGGDEFLCGLLDVTMPKAAERFSLASESLAKTLEAAAFTFGIAELEADDALRDLIVRADKALYTERRRL